MDTQNIFEGAYYVLNSDNKIELHLNGKQHYQNLPEDAKKDIKRAFVWGRQRGAWVSRSKDSGIPWPMRGYSISLKAIEDRKEYTEAREQKIERAENKADRYEVYAQSREKQAESLQSEFNRLRQDWSWLTQPNVNTSGGRSFTRSRERVMARYNRSFESMDKAQQHREYAASLRITASETELKSESYLLNRVKEGKKAVRMFDKFQQRYASMLEKIDEQSDEAKIWLTARMNYYQTSFEKLDFFQDALDELTEQRSAKGVITHADIDERIKGLKSEVKRYLKEKYNVDLLKFNAAFGKGIRKHYYIQTVQPLPTEYHSGWAADNCAQVPVAQLIKDIDAFYQA